MLPFKTVPKLSDIKKHFPQAKAALWDMDGTLFDSEVLHMNTLMAMAGLTELKPEHLQLKQQCVGLTDDMALTILHQHGHLTQFDHAEFIKVKDQKFAQALEEYPLDSLLHPSIVELLSALKQEQIKIALVTSAERYTTDLCMQKSGLLNFFEFTLTKQDVTNPKPHPEPYQIAMQKLGVTPQETVIFEDSEAGTTAATLSGANVIKALWYTKLQ